MLRALGGRLGQHLLELAGCCVQRAVMVVHKADGALRDDLLQMQLHDLTAGQCILCHGLGQERNAQLTFDKGQHLVGGGSLGIRLQHRTVLTTPTAMMFEAMLDILPVR